MNTDKKTLNIKNLRSLDMQALKELKRTLLLQIIAEQSMGQVKKPQRKLYKKGRARIFTILGGYNV